LDRAAEAKIAASVSFRTRSRRRRRPGQPQSTPGHPQRASKTPRPPTAAATTQGQSVHKKALDDVILSYLADDGDGEPPSGKR
jgi:hypothetical protein